MGTRLRTKVNKSPDKIQRGQMYWADIPHDRCNPHAQHGLRPVVVISNDLGNANSPSLLVCPLTTQKDKYYQIHPNVMCEGTLSYVQCEQIKVLDKELLGGYIGKVREVEQHYIDRGLATSTDLLHYLQDLHKLTSELDAIRSELQEANRTIESLESRINELETENSNYKSNQDTFELGNHVKGIMSILSKQFESTNAQPFMPMPQDNIRTDDKLTSQPRIKGTKKVKSHKRLSPIEKFNKRLEKHNQLVNSVGEVSSTVSSSNLSRPTDRKWDEHTISQFMEDYNNLLDEELLKKYNLRRKATASEYHRKFSKCESL